MTLGLVIVGSVVATVLVGAGLTVLHRRSRSLRWTVLGVAVAAVLVASVVVAASTSAMFLTGAQLRLVLAALALGAALGVVVAVSVTEPLSADLHALATAAQRVADGDLEVRTGIARNDEVGALASSVDRMVAQLHELQEQRLRGEAARRHLLTSIGHDLRTPLASMQAAIEALEDGVAPDPGRYLRSMAADVTLLGDMVGDLFTLTQLEAGELGLDPLPVELGELADGAVEAIGPLADRRGIEVVTIAPEPVTVHVDPQALDRVLRNLLDNAVRHAPDGGRVLVTVGESTGAGEPGDRADRRGTVRVHDDGPGFDPAFVARAFERFSRSDEARVRRRGGAGLGLAIARELVDAHGGRIWIEPSEGATVAFDLPAAP